MNTGEWTIQREKKRLEDINQCHLVSSQYLKDLIKDNQCHLTQEVIIIEII
jgi:hypothetical protein